MTRNQPEPRAAACNRPFSPHAIGREGESNLSAICTNAKARGTTIITIAYNIDDSDTVDRLRNCTTDPASSFFDIGTDNNVASAFDAIKKQITAQVRIGK